MELKLSLIVALVSLIHGTSSTCTCFDSLAGFQPPGVNSIPCVAVIGNRSSCSLHCKCNNRATPSTQRRCVVADVSSFLNERYTRYSFSSW